MTEPTKPYPYGTAFIVVCFYWVVGTAFGMGVLWAFWDTTRCKPVEGSLADDCTGEARFEYWSAWPIMVAWSIIVLGVLLYFTFRPRRDEVVEQ